MGRRGEPRELNVDHGASNSELKDLACSCENGVAERALDWDGLDRSASGECKVVALLPRRSRARFLKEGINGVVEVVGGGHGCVERCRETGFCEPKRQDTFSRVQDVFQLDGSYPSRLTLGIQRASTKWPTATINTTTLAPL